MDMGNPPYLIDMRFEARTPEKRSGSIPNFAGFPETLRTPYATNPFKVNDSCLKALSNFLTKWSIFGLDPDISMDSKRLEKGRYSRGQTA
jgi:hypothetical protein